MLSKNKKTYTIILDVKVKDDIDKLAKEQDRSSSWLINHILKEYLENISDKKINKKAPQGL
jgi:predicted transcriptional regulator